MKIKDIVKVKNLDKYKHLENFYGVVVSVDENEKSYQVAFLDLENNKAVELITIKEENLCLVIKNTDVDGKEIKYLDKVELITDDYIQSGAKKGQTGVVLELDTHIDKVLVDFTSVDKKLKVNGDCLLIECKHLKVL